MAATVNYIWCSLLTFSTFELQSINFRIQLQYQNEYAGFTLSLNSVLFAVVYLFIIIITIATDLFI